MVQPIYQSCYQSIDCPNGTSLVAAFSVCQKQVTSLSIRNKPTLLSQFLSCETPATTSLSSTDKFTASTITVNGENTKTTLSTSSSTLQGKQGKASKLLWYIGGSTVVFVSVTILVIVCIRRFKRISRQKKLKELFDGLISGSTMTNKYTEHSDVMLKMDDIEIDFFSVLGKGSNSMVHKGHFKQKNSDKFNHEVAVKIPISFEKEDINLFKLELDAYVRIGSHPHIITFYGWILYQNSPALVSELASQNLITYVRSFRKKQISTRNFFSILLQISQALKHVAALNIIHRDVACRNILMINNDYVKLADFGLCCKCNDTATYYASSRKKLPLKWLSIEAITQKKFSEKSDIWAFGILCYEIFSCGNEPYSTFSAVEMLEFLQSGKRLMIPEDTPEPISLIMTDCWNENPDDRPTFAILEQKLREILEDQAVKYGYVKAKEIWD